MRALNRNLNLSEPSAIVSAKAGGLQNLVPNPQFFHNVTDGWGDHGYLTRDTDPPVALPDNCESSARFDAGMD